MVAVLFVGKDASLAECLLRPTPYSVAEEVLELTEKNYGSVRRMYVVTMEDKLFSPQEQEHSIAENPPERVFRMEVSDHSPFFSRPHQLCDLLESIANFWVQKCLDPVAQIAAIQNIIKCKSLSTSVLGVLIFGFIAKWRIVEMLE